MDNPTPATDAAPPVEPATADPHAPHPAEFAEKHHPDGTIRNVFHVGRSLGTRYLTLGAVPPLQLTYDDALALAVWLTVAVGVDEVADHVARARAM